MLCGQPRSGHSLTLEVDEMATLQRIGELFTSASALLEKRTAARSSSARSPKPWRQKSGRIDAPPGHDRHHAASPDGSRRSNVFHQRRQAGRRTRRDTASDSDPQGNVGELSRIASDRGQGGVFAQHRKVPVQAPAPHPWRHDSHRGHHDRQPSRIYQAAVEAARVSRKCEVTDNQEGNQSRAKTGVQFSPATGSLCKS